MISQEKKAGTHYFLISETLFCMVDAIQKGTVMSKISPSKIGIREWRAALALLVFLFFSNFMYVQMRSGLDPFLDALAHPHLVMGSIAALIALFTAIGILAGPLGPIRGILCLCVVTFYQLLSGYHFVTKSPFDFSVMAYNSTIAFTFESLEIIRESVGITAVLFSVGYSVLSLAWTPLRTILFSATYLSPRRIAVGMSAASAYLLLSLSGLAPYDEFGQFLLSIVSHYRTAEQFHFTDRYPAGTYPLLVTEKEPSVPARRPHIFLIEIESFNPRFIEKKSKNGQEIMPFFSSLIPQGLYVDLFYGNSVQSAKGQFTTLFSLVPTIRYKEFLRYTDTSLYSLADALRDAGYTTWFVKAYKNIQFDNTGVFVLRHGFDRAFSIHDHLRPGDTDHIWGWGIEDQLFYRRFFEHLDTREEIVSGKQPLFVVLHTVMNHMKFNKTPRELRYIYPEPQTMEENFANTIHLSDRHLAVFFSEMAKRDYLKDHLVVITGDHGFTTGEHGYEHNELYYFEECFRTPFLLLYPGIVEPNRVSDTAFSQLDIAPTILDAIGYRPQRHHFQGQSIIHPQDAARPIYLVQPYNGTYLGIVEYPMKFVHHLRSGEEMVFDLQRDPRETKNLVTETDSVRLARWRAMLEQIYLVQYLLETDNVWPGQAN